MKKRSNNDKLIAYLSRRKTPASVADVVHLLGVSTDAARAALNYARKYHGAKRGAKGWSM